MERLIKFALGYYLFGIGLFLVLAPWTPLWSWNWFVRRTGPLSVVLLSSWARGALSGVGALFILAGVRDTLRLAMGRTGEHS